MMKILLTLLRTLTLFLFVASFGTFITWTLTACSDDDEIDEADLTAICEDFADLYCSKVFDDCPTECALLAPFLGGSKDACKTSLTTLCNQDNGEGTDEEGSSGNEVTKEEVEACINSIEAQSCSDFCTETATAECDKLSE